MELFDGRTFELFVLTLVISLAVSEVLYRLVERPAMRLEERSTPRGSRSTRQHHPQRRDHQQLRREHRPGPPVGGAQRAHQ